MAGQELKARERYRFLVESAARTGTLWALSLPDRDGLVTFADPRNHVVVPFWPTPEDATKLATGDWGDAVPTKIPVVSLLEREVGPMEKEDVQIAAFPTPNSSGASVRAVHFARALRNALGQE